MLSLTKAVLLHNERIIIREMYDDLLRNMTALLNACPSSIHRSKWVFSSSARDYTSRFEHVIKIPLSSVANRRATRGKRRGFIPRSCMSCVFSLRRCRHRDTSSKNRRYACQCSNIRAIDPLGALETLHAPKATLASMSTRYTGMLLVTCSVASLTAPREGGLLSPSWTLMGGPTSNHGEDSHPPFVWPLPRSILSSSH